MNVLGCFSWSHEWVNATDTELTVAEVAEERLCGLEEEEYRDEDQHEVDGLQVDSHLASCKTFDPGLRVMSPNRRL